MTTTVNHLPGHDSLENLARRLRILQTMQAVLKQAPSEQLKTFVQAQREKESDPTMLAFLNLLATDNQRNRDIAYSIFKDMETAVQAEQAATIDGTSAKDANTVAAAMAPVETSAPSNEPAAEKALETLGESATDQPDLRTELHSPRPVEEDAVEKAPTLVPFTLIDEEVEKVSFTLSKEGEESVERVYSIITAKMDAAVLAPVKNVTGVIIGIKGQDKVEHGFGFVLPISEEGLTIDRTGKERCIIRIAMGYPQSLSFYDDHQGPRLRGVSYFMAVHEIMNKGYRFLLDLEIVPINGRFALSMRPGCWIERTDGQGNLARMASTDLDALEYATDNLDFVGFLANAEIAQ